MLDVHQGDPVLMMDEAAWKMKEAWAHKNQHKVDMWNVQMQQDRVKQ